ncbi:hypothetical protein NVP1101O_163 [Vibrio phage 1.101.O._10N.261.45.C6]|nr:hypothetical protein NVP1101O_163 [Vibrio phage 1.101.O._10N.261.45.C6]
MIKLDIEKAKQIAHEVRRQDRAVKMQPLDEIISKQIPDSNLNDVEKSREVVREVNAKVQLEIEELTVNTDAKNGTEQLVRVLNGL